MKKSHDIAGHTPGLRCAVKVKTQEIQRGLLKDTVVNEINWQLYQTELLTVL